MRKSPYEQAVWTASEWRRRAEEAEGEMRKLHASDQPVERYRVLRQEAQACRAFARQWQEEADRIFKTNLNQ